MKRKSAGRFGVDHDAVVVVIVEHFIGESRPLVLIARARFDESPSLKPRTTEYSENRFTRC